MPNPKPISRIGRRTKSRKKPLEVSGPADDATPPSSWYRGGMVIARQVGYSEPRVVATTTVSPAGGSFDAQKKRKEGWEAQEKMVRAHSL